MTRIHFRLFSALLLASISLPVIAQSHPKYPNYPSETPAHFHTPQGTFDYTRRDVMIPMRDGVRLHTVILIPKGAHKAGILLTRTLYDANDLTTHEFSSHLGPSLQGYDNATDVILLPLVMKK